MFRVAPVPFLKRDNFAWVKQSLLSLKFLQKNNTESFFYDYNGTLFIRSDDRSEVGICMEWD